MTTLEDLHRQLAVAQRQLDSLNDAAKLANETYEFHRNEAIREFERVNPIMVGDRNRLNDWRKTAEATVETLRREAKALTTSREDVAGLSGFNVKEFRVPEYDEGLLFKAALQYAPWLLQLNEDAVRQFALNNADTTVGSLMQPFLPLKVRMEPRLEISNEKVAATTSDKPGHGFKVNDWVSWKGQTGIVVDVRFAFVRVEIGGRGGVSQFWQCDNSMTKVEPPKLATLPENLPQPEAVLKLD